MTTQTRWQSRIVGHSERDPRSITPHPLNPRRHPDVQRDVLVGVLDEVGWVQDVVYNVRTGRLIDGHLRVEVALERGEPTVPTVDVDLSEDEERLILSVFDPITALATTDQGALDALLAQVSSNDDAVQKLLASLDSAPATAIPGITEPDDVPELQPAVTQRGDVWALGPHRVMCGDSADQLVLLELFGGNMAEWVWTDPPYGANYVGKTNLSLVIQNDTEPGIPDLLASVFANIDSALVGGCPIYVAHPPGPTTVEFMRAFDEAGWHLHQDLIWVKDVLVLGHSDYHYKHEGILYGWKGKNRPWFGGRTQESIFQIAKPKRSESHPTMKPAALVEAHLTNSTAPESLGLDPFLGSGTTLIAAERLNRVCYGIDIDERYVDVAVRRWEAFTGRDAVLISDGRTFTQAAEDRA